MSYYICNKCNYGSVSWLGRCPSCGEWNTFFEKEPAKEQVEKLTITPLYKIKTLAKQRKKTGIFEFDRVLGHGFVPGSVVLLTGEPGVGKSTLLLQALQQLHALYISGEESAEQIKDRADRLKIDLKNFYFSESVQIEGIIEGVNNLEKKPEIMVVDSIQTVYSKNLNVPPGNISQLKESANKLIGFAKKNKIPIIIIGHITKEGDIAGPKTLEHLVDCVLSFEGETRSSFRILRATKNRFGSTDEIGVFEMTEQGLKEATNPLIFLNQDSSQLTAGKSIVGVSEGKRSLFFEIQALTTPTNFPYPKRVVKGIDYNKLLLLLAVIRKNLGLVLDKFDVYINVVGGVKINSTSADLGIVASLLSSIKNVFLPPQTVFIGEVGLLGEIRENNNEIKIIKEARRLKFKRIFSSNNLKNIKELKQIITP